MTGGVRLHTEGVYIPTEGIQERSKEVCAHIKERSLLQYVKMNYLEFLKSKIDIAKDSGFEVNPEEINQALKPHQRDSVVWAIRGGNCIDCPINEWCTDGIFSEGEEAGQQLETVVLKNVKKS